MCIVQTLAKHGSRSIQIAQLQVQEFILMMLRKAFEDTSSRDAAPYALLEVIADGDRLPCQGLLFIGC